MGKAIITFKIMPGDAGVDLKPISEQAQTIARDNGSIGDMVVEEKPVAFGLKAVMVKAMYDVDGNDFDAIAEKMAKIENVQTAEVAGMDIPLG